MAEYSTRNRSKLFKSGLVDTSDIKDAAVTLDKLAPEVVAEYAAKTYVDTAVSNLIDSAPGVLDTLNELAAAINDDANFFTTVNNSIATKLNSADFDSTFDTRLASKDTDDLTEGSNLYFTDARVQTKLGNISGHLIPDANITYDLGSATYRFRDLYLSGNTIYLDGITLSNDNGTFSVTTESNQPVVLSLSANTTSDLAEGSNLYYTEARVDANIALKTTADITEGTNLYWTVARGEAMFDTRLTTKTTDNLAEGSTNQYFTTARARASVSASDGLSYSPSTGIFSIADTGVTAGSYGSASLVPVITVNANGQITSASTVAVAGVTNFTYTAGTNTYSISTADGGLFSASGDLSSFDTGDLTEGVNLYYTTARWDARLATKTTDDLTEGSNLYYTTARWDARLATKTTNDLTEGTNLYYTDSRVRNAISVVDSGGDGSLSYNSTSGVITYTGPSATEVRAHFSAGTGVTYSAGQFSIGQAVATTSNVTFADINASGNLVIDGNLTVNGTTTTISATNLAIEDNLIYLNEGSTSANPDLGITGNYNDGTYAHTGVFRDATDNRWKFFKGYTPEPGTSIDTTHASFAYADVQGGTFYGAFSGNASTASTWQTARTNTVTLTGDVAGSGSASVDGSGNWTVSVATTVQANSVALGTDTTGNYMVDVAAGSGITVSHTQGEGSTATVSHADTSSVANLSSDNANGVVIQDVALTFDTYGHVQTATVATVDLDGRYYTETEADSRFVNVTGDTMTGSLHINSDDGVRATYQSTDGTTWLRGWGIESNRGTVYLRPTGNNTQTLNIGYSAGSQLWNTINLGASGINAEGVITATSGGHRFGNLLVGEGTYKNSITPIGDSNMNLNTPSGSVYVTTNIRSPIFYDSNDTNYYLDAASSSVLNNLSVGSVFTNGAISTNTFNVSVSSTVFWTITQPDGSAIANGDIYRISMSTSGTGTDTGEVYLLSNPDSLGWQVKLVSSTGRGSNYPYVFLDSGVPKIRTDHPSTYGIKTIIQKFGFGNTGSLTTGLGLEAYFSVDQGTPKFRGTWNGTDYTVWHSNNDGSGSGLDADLLDGLHSSSFLQTGADISGITTIRSTNFRAENAYYLGENNEYLNRTNGGWYSNVRIQSEVDMRTPIFYDSNDTSKYLDPNSSSNINLLTLYGHDNQLKINTYAGGASGWFAQENGVNKWETYHYSGQYRFYNYTTAQQEAFFDNASGYFQVRTSVRAPIFYDSNDTGYYIDANSKSRIYGLRIAGDASSTDINNQIFLWSDSTTSAIGFKSNGGSFTNPTGNGDGYNTYLTMDTDGRGWVFRRGVGGTDFGAAYTSGWILNNGVWQANSSMRAPIFYDSNDTGYYINPNSESKIVKLWINNGGAGGVGWSTGLNMGDGSNYWNMIQDAGIARQRNYGTGGYDWFNSGASQLMTLSNGGTLSVSSDMRAPIFYDSNDTGYYVDPNSTTNLNVLNTGGVRVTPQEYGPSMVGNFGQWQAHSAYASGFDVEPSYWGWNYVQGNVAAPNGTSSQWYRNRVSLGDAYGKGTASGDYWMEFAYPRYTTKDAGGMFIRTCESGSVTGWTQVGSKILGDFVATGNVTAYSDIRVKKDIRIIEDALDKVSKLRGVTYDRTDSDSPRQTGVIAQEVLEVLPEAVIGSEETQYAVAYGNMVGLLIEAIKEQQTTIESQQSVINTQEERIARLEALVQQMLDK